ncbi:hypothetical protein MBLNU230_g6912t2 [Neophaeotheca triangularis]
MKQPLTQPPAPMLHLRHRRDRLRPDRLLLHLHHRPGHHRGLINAYVESTCTTALEAEGETYEASTPPACPGADASETEEDAPEESAAPVPAPTEEDDSDAVATESVVAVETETAVVPVPAGTASATGAVPAASSPPAEFEGVAASNGAGFGLVAGVAALAFAL